ncbi:MAG TPA: HAMP domain-containing protein [bacterium]|nr:HAMP domain-containing protein [bacterium]
MNVFLFWIILIILILVVYLFMLFRRSQPGFRFQVKLITIFILLVLIPAIPLTTFVSSLLTRGVEIFLPSGVDESLSVSLEIIKSQLEDKGRFWLDHYQTNRALATEMAANEKIVYFTRFRSDDQTPEIIEISGSETHTSQFSPIYNTERLEMLKRREATSFFFAKDNRFFCEVYQYQSNATICAVAFEVDPKLIDAKDNITETLRIYNSLSLFKKSIVEGQIIWGIATLFILLLTVITIYTAKTLARSISEPIQELTKGMQRVAEGDSQTQVDVKARDEIKFLVDSFNQMTRDLKISQQKLMRAERLAAWQDIARRVSHEIKNSLTPLGLSIRRLWNNLSQTESVAQSLATMQDEVESLRRMSEAFSDFARMPQIKMQKQDLNEIIQSLVTLFSAEPGAPEFRLNLDKNLPIVNCDPMQLRRAFQNIIKNAIEANKEAATKQPITINTSRQEHQTELVKIDIIDKGKGMDEQVLSNIFEPYFTTKARGMGLGMAIVKRIIEDHNGDIEISSQPGQGTRVTMYL